MWKGRMIKNMNEWKKEKNKESRRKKKKESKSSSFRSNLLRTIT